MECERNMKKKYFQNCKNIKPSKHGKKIEIETLLFKTILPPSFSTIVLNHNLLEQAGAHWV
jgi:hypothetical protein